MVVSAIVTPTAMASLCSQWRRTLRNHTSHISFWRGARIRSDPQCVRPSTCTGEFGVSAGTPQILHPFSFTFKKAGIGVSCLLAAPCRSAGTHANQFLHSLAPLFQRRVVHLLPRNHTDGCSPGGELFSLEQMSARSAKGCTPSGRLECTPGSLRRPMLACFLQPRVRSVSLSLSGRTGAGCAAPHFQRCPLSTAQVGHLHSTRQGRTGPMW